MKNLFLVISIAAMFSLSACGQKSKDVPAEVKTAFELKFPDAKKVKWEKENEKVWEVEFKMSGTEYSACFDADGAWKETEHEIKVSEIPAVVKSTLDSEFEGFEIDEAEMIESSEGTFYEFELEKGETEMEVVIDPNGMVISKEAEKEDSDKDEDDD